MHDANPAQLDRLAPELSRRTRLMLDLAQQAGELVIRHFQHPGLVVHSKGAAGPVTIADRQAEQLIRDAISAHFPSDGLLGEEYGTHESTTGWTWVIDPIDGTVSFAAGVPLFGVLIALQHEDAQGRRVRAGVCHLPALGECIWAAEGAGAWWQRAGQATIPARVSTCQDLGSALLCTTGPEYYAQAARQEAYVQITRTAGRVRGWSDCYAFALAATGRIDVAIDPIMHPWDSGPFAVILPEAGGIFSGWTGQPSIHAGDAIACNPRLHQQVLNLVKPWTDRRAISH